MDAARAGGWYADPATCRHTRCRQDLYKRSWFECVLGLACGCVALLCCPVLVDVEVPLEPGAGVVELGPLPVHFAAGGPRALIERPNGTQHLIFDLAGRPRLVPANGAEAPCVAHGTASHEVVLFEDQLEEGFHLVWGRAQGTGVLRHHRRTLTPYLSSPLLKQSSPDPNSPNCSSVPGACTR